MAIEEEFGIQIPNEAAEHIVSVGDAAEQIKNAKKSVSKEGVAWKNADAVGSTLFCCIKYNACSGKRGHL